MGDAPLLRLLVSVATDGGHRFERVYADGAYCFNENWIYLCRDNGYDFVTSFNPTLDRLATVAWRAGKLREDGVACPTTNGSGSPVMGRAGNASACSAIQEALPGDGGCQGGPRHRERDGFAGEGVQHLQTHKGRVDAYDRKRCGDRLRMGIVPSGTDCPSPIYRTQYFSHQVRNIRTWLVRLWIRVSS